MTSTYGDVDQGRDPVQAADWQDRLAGWPAIRAYKRRTHELLGPQRPVLDVGCGTGVDLPVLGPGAIGVDRSEVMAARAASRGAVVRGDAHRLPLADASVAGARADRTVQHLEDPIDALAQLVRVVRPGGRVVVSDPDQGSLVIEVPGVAADLVDRVRSRRRDRQYRHGTLARRYPDLLAGLGLDEITVDAFALVLTEPDDAFGIATWVAHAADEGTASPADVTEWERGIDRARRFGGFVYAVTFLVVSDRKET